MGIFGRSLFLLCFFCSRSGSVENSDCESHDCCEQWDDKNQKCAVCFPGYLGWNCSEICPHPNYGRECQEKCECDERLCDIATGCFPVDDGCRSGYFGHRCINKCKYPNYGKGCQSKCGCFEENCNFINGCYVPESTSHHPDHDSFNEAGSNRTTSFRVVLLVSAVTSISLSIIITLMVWCIRRLRKSKTGSPRRDRTNECQGDQSNGYVSDARPSRFYSSNVLVSTTQHERDDDPYLALGSESSVSCKEDYSEYDEIKFMAAP